MAIADRVSVVSTSRRWRWVCSDTEAATTAITVGTLVAVIATLALPRDGLFVANQLLVWTVLLMVYTAIMWLRLRPLDEEQLIAWVRANDQVRDQGTSRLRYWSVGRGSAHPIAYVGMASAVGVGAAAFVLPQAERLSETGAGVLVVLSLAAVAASWLALHVAYSQHYTVLYHRRLGTSKPLVFPGGRAPIYDDFAYFALSLGTTVGVTDVSVTSTSMRRVVRTHMLLSFLYNTVVLALALAVVLG